MIMGFLALMLLGVPVGAAMGLPALLGLGCWTCRWRPSRAI